MNDNTFINVKLTPSAYHIEVLGYSAANELFDNYNIMNDNSGTFDEATRLKASGTVSYLLEQFELLKPKDDNHRFRVISIDEARDYLSSLMLKRDIDKLNDLTKTTKNTKINIKQSKKLKNTL